MASPKTKTPVVNVDKESPEYILAAVEESFAIAAKNLKNPASVKHPTKRNVTIVDSYPLIPDLEAMPDPGGYVAVKFASVLSYRSQGSFNVRFAGTGINLTLPGPFVGSNIVMV